jgi:RNA polymerase sigma-70 factor (ECF subfamily)
MADCPDWDSIIRGLKDGDPDVCSRFWKQHGANLEAIAGQQLSRKLQRRVGPDDIVQSVFRTFFRRMAGGEFEVPDAGAMWRLMCAITLTKARRAARDHRRLKRGLNSESALSEAEQEYGADFSSQLAGSEHDPSLALEMSDQLQTLLGQLGDEECQVLELKMNDRSNEQIADILGCSERTVRRIVNKVQSRWQAMMDEAIA